MPVSYHVANGLEWLDNSTNEVGFIIERKEQGSLFEEIIALPQDQFRFYDQYQIEGGKTYTYRVGVFNKSGMNYFPEVTIVSNPPKTLPGEMPQNLDAKVLSPYAVQLNWYDNISEPEDWYYVLRSENPSYGASVVAWYQGGNPGTGYMSFIDQAATPNTKYWYFILAEKFVSGIYTGWPSSNIIEVITPPDPYPNHPPSVPGLSGYSSSGDKTLAGNYVVSIDILPVGNEKGYSIERSDNSTQNFIEIMRKFEPQPIPFFVDKTVKSGNFYYYRVRAYNDYGFGGYSPPTIFPIAIP